MLTNAEPLEFTKQSGFHVKLETLSLSQPTSNAGGNEDADRNCHVPDSLNITKVAAIDNSVEETGIDKILQHICTVTEMGSGYEHSPFISTPEQNR
jgi:hypothetical protein